MKFQKWDWVSYGLCFCSSNPDSDYDHEFRSVIEIRLWKFWLVLPFFNIIKPYKKWNTYGDTGFYEMHRSEYGFKYHDGLFTLLFGAQTHDSSTTKDKSWFLPWTQWQHVRHEKFGEVIKFSFKDFDGELITANTQIEEREWHFGTGYFKWLKYFRKYNVQRSLDIQFSSETGKRKGSWKGGTLGHGITMTSGEDNKTAFVRYCSENNMTFIN